jgi:hypothetical protein
VAILLVVGALSSIAAADPRGDVAPCRRTEPGPGHPPDLVAATGTIAEEGSSLKWVLRFARPLTVPDHVGKPFRIDVLIRDPSVPALDVAYYRDVNRIVRYDAVVDPSLVVLSLPERAEDLFNPPIATGPRLVIQVPGRMITRDVDLLGPALARLRWTVVVRDQHRCDALGSSRPHLRFDREPVSPSPGGTSSRPAPLAGTSPALPAIGSIVAVAIVVTVVWAAWRRRRHAR